MTIDAPVLLYVTIAFLCGQAFGSIIACLLFKLLHLTQRKDQPERGDRLHCLVMSCI